MEPYGVTLFDYVGAEILDFGGAVETVSSLFARDGR